MGMEPDSREKEPGSTPGAFSAWHWLTLLAVLVGLALSIDAIFQSSATYDEVAYLRIAARWWRTGDQTEITRMGSPLTFWKLQQVPVLWTLDHIGQREWIDEPIANQRKLLPIVRLGSLWIWLLAIATTAAWARQSYGPRAMALAAWLFALSPNLIAHGTLATMELPLVAATTVMFWFFWRFLDSPRWRWFWISACAAGLAFSCKFTAVVFPPILGVMWWLSSWHAVKNHLIRLTWTVSSRMLAFVIVMLVTNIALTGFARIPLSTSQGQHPSLERWVGTNTARRIARLYEAPLPQDWVGFATQMHHQASGGPSYLWGERRVRGWWYYYFVALAVKVPVCFWVLVVARLTVGRVSTLEPRTGQALFGKDWPPQHFASPTEQDGAPHEASNPTHSTTNLLPVVFVLFLTITAIGSSRNYGVRYLLPLAPLAIVWVSGLAECRRAIWPRIAVAIGLAGLCAAVAGSHPYELTYFNLLASGPEGGRHILADSNLDWGQGLETLSRLQRERPEFRQITFYYFGDTHPAHYGVAGRCHVINAVDDQSHLPGLDRVETPYLAVSASLQYGPWGPSGFFCELNRLRPVRLTDDKTIAIYRTADLRGELAAAAHQ
jgi:4-amino-4-deoxy-L-arabinose transferase-like glycosyltransferase